MGPKELSEAADLVDSLPAILDQINTPSLDYNNPHTMSFRKNIAELRSKGYELIGIFPREAFPLANKAIKRFANKVDVIVHDFPGDVIRQRINVEELRNIWYLEVKPSIYSLELALAVTGGVFLPEDPAIFRGKDRIFRDIALEINICYRNGALNACSVLLRRLVETLIIKVHEQKGTASIATNPSSGRFYKLEKLVDDVINGNPFGLTRNAIDALPHLKRLGDWGAHNRNISIRRSDLDDIKADSRLCFEELIRLS